MSAVLFLLCLAASVGALIHAISVINVMSRRTSHFIRLVYCTLAAGSFANVGFLLMGGDVTMHGTIITLVVAGMTIADRRRVGHESERTRTAIHGVRQ